MHWNQLFLTGSAIVAVVAMAGCEQQQPTSEAAAPAPATAASSAAPTAAAANDEATVKACEDIKKDIKDNAAKVAKAEKIGPPAGHIAVSAQWTAGSAAVIAHSIGANDAVSAAAEKVQGEMSKLSDAYNESAKAKPSKKELAAAVADLNAACSAS